MHKVKQIILLLLFFSAKFSFSQGITLTETLTYLNEKFKGKYVFDVKAGQLTLDCYNNGTKIRQDKVYISDLNPLSLTYSEEEKAVILKCLDDKGDCIDRRLLTQKSKNYYKRIAFLMEGETEKSINGVQRALTHLIRLIQDKSYKSAEPFEE